MRLARKQVIGTHNGNIVGFYHLPPEKNPSGP